jgi:hypothetical protein
MRNPNIKSQSQNDFVMTPSMLRVVRFLVGQELHHQAVKLIRMALVWNMTAWKDFFANRIRQTAH